MAGSILLTTRMVNIGARPYRLHPNQCRHFSQSIPCLVNPLLNLSHFSAAKEAQFLSKERKIPREEFHPYLELIRSSEVDPFAPVPGASPTRITALENAKAGKVDKEATYTLVLSNMMAQVESAKRGSFQLTSMLMAMQEKQAKDERNTLLFMLVAVGLLSVVMLKTRALEDLKDYAFGVGNELGAVDRNKLGDARSPLTESSRTRLVPPETRTSLHSEMSLVRKSQIDSSSSHTFRPTTPSLPPSQESGWSFSRLFWAR